MMIKKNFMYWQRLHSSPARNNESLVLEMSWAWEPTDRSGA